MITTSAQLQMPGTTLAPISGTKEVGAARRLPALASQVDTTQSNKDVDIVGKAKLLTDVVKKYDVRNMSPRDMAAMSQELYQDGAISLQDHALLSFQPELNSELYKTLAGTPGQPNAPRDFIAQWEKQLQVHENMGDMNFARNDQRILNILGNLAALRESATPA